MNRNILIDEQFKINREIDSILKIAGCKNKVKFYNLFEEKFGINRIAGFYNVLSGEIIELQDGQTHSDDEFSFTYEDFDNGWVRYGIYPIPTNTFLYVSTIKREFANKCIKFIENKYPDKIFSKYEIELMTGPNTDSLLITLDSDKKLLRENNNFIFSSKNIWLLKYFNIDDIFNIYDL